MRRTTLLVLSASLALVLACSCSSQMPSQASSSPPIMEADDAPLVEKDWTLHLGFTGDVCLADNYIPMQHLAEIESEKLEDGISADYLSLMRAEDILWVNNEFCFSDTGEALAGKAWTFKAKTENVSYLEDMGADIVGLANNHVFDYGSQSFEDTLTTLQNAGIPYVGAGWSERDAYAPVYIDKNGVRVAYVAASSAEYTIYTLEAEPDKPGIAWCYDNEKFLNSIREAASNADFVVALPHWGTEHTTELTDVQTQGARAYIDAGADVVIGTHPHILQGIEYYKGKPICYSLGNFWFDEYDIDTVLAEIRLHGTSLKGEQPNISSVELVVYPGVQSGACTRLSTSPDEKGRIFRLLEEISPSSISISSDGVVKPA